MPRLINSIILLMLVISVHSKDFKLIDAKTKEPLVFATVIYKSDKLRGKITDIDGKFNLDLTNIEYIRFSYTGYQSLKLSVSKIPQDGVIKLGQLSHDIDEVIVYPKENPAHKIMDSLRIYSDIHNPSNLNSYQCKEYIKTSSGYLFDMEKLDSSNMEIKDFFEDSDLIFNENFFERSYKKNSGMKLILKASKSSGFKSTPLYIPVEDVQPYHFYEKLLLILDINYFNPIYDEDFSFYWFKLSDSLETDSGLVYRIDFKPKTEFAENGLLGTFYINKKDYALESVVAKTDKSRKISGKIEQKYKKQKGRWFPIQHKYTLNANSFNSGIGVFIRGKTYISEVEYNMPSNVSFNAQFVEFSDDMKLNDSLYFAKNRPVKLEFIEQNTYLKIDTTLEKHDLSLDGLVVILEKLGHATLPISVFDIDLLQIYNSNSIEGNRFGLGLYTNEEISDRFSIGGYLAYGKRDEDYKFGAKLNINLSKSNLWKLSFSISDDFKLPKKKSLFKDYIVYDYTRFKDYSVSSSFNIFYFDFDIGLTKQKITPYVRLKDEPDVYRTTEFKFNLSFDVNKKLVPSFANRYNTINFTNPKTEKIIPIINFNYAEGVQNLFGGEYSYSKFNLSFDNRIIFSEIGTFFSKVDLGLIDREITYAKLFSGNSIFAEESFLYFDNVFQTIKPNEFSNSKYVNVFWKFRFVPIAFSFPYSRPTISLVHNFGYGELEPQIKIDNPSLKDMADTYHESGLVFSNLVRVPLKIAYLGVGGSTFLRWGKYEYDKFEKNLNIKLHLKLTF
jgi:hypothetical protein